MNEDHNSEFVGELDWDKVNVPTDTDDDETWTPASESSHTLRIDESSVVKDGNEKPRALQIVSIGTETDAYAFTFHEDSLNQILCKIRPSSMKVCVISVVGAFRTGKSFLLSCFLRYLHYHSLTTECKDKDRPKTKWYEKFASLGNDGFNWRGGSDRNTTGIWMWSHPYILPSSSHPSEKIALLLVDTQGMFDHETTMALTASIFGLSTLLSSYQIYNVDKRIQEDNLQQLALFSEYGRMALNVEENRQQQHDQQQRMAEEKNLSSHTDMDDSEDDNVTPVAKTDSSSTTCHKPFQHIEFLVRDWQHFEDEDNLDACELEMNKYLDSVIAQRDAADLKDTREQITSCFDIVSCFMLTHPGFTVTKKNYTGEVATIDPTFLALLDRYCHRIFGYGTVDGMHEDASEKIEKSNNLVPKAIHGRELTAAELGAYIKAYANLFSKGATHFPEASTMLEATSAANNANATTLSIAHYKARMEAVVGVRCSDYVSPKDLDTLNLTVVTESLNLFDDIANFGSKKAIESSRIVVEKTIQDSFELYSKLNESRNPLAGIGIYIIPIAVGVLSVFLRWIADWTCSSWSHTCRASSDVLSHVYQVVFFFMVIVASTKAKQVSEVLTRMKKAFDVIVGDSSPRPSNVGRTN